MFIEAGDQIETFAAGLEEGVLCSHANLLEGFQAVADKCRANDEHPFDSLLGQAGEFEICIRFQPRITAKPGLERHREFFWRDASRAHEGFHSFEALSAIACIV